MSTAIIIPSRIGATRLPRKPLADINGKPMILHVYERCVKANIADVFVATDSNEIVDLIAKHGGKSIMTNPDLPSGTDRVYAAITSIDSNKKYKTVINVQGDIPNISPDVIVQTANLLNEIPECDITTPVCLISDQEKRNKPSVVKPILSFRGAGYAKALYFTRSTCPHGDGELYEHIGLYVYKRDALEKFVKLSVSTLEKRESLEQLRALENDMVIYAKVVSSAPVSVDVPEDLEAARKVCL